MDERRKPYWDESSRSDSNDWTEDALLPTIALIDVPHPTIPNLYERCYEYVERGQWDWETELVGTGRWFHEPTKDGDE